MKRLNTLYERVVSKEDTIPPFADPQDPKIIRMLNSQPLYYHSNDEAMVAGQRLKSGIVLTYSEEDARRMGKKFVYAVDVPDKFAYITQDNNQLAKYHIMSQSEVTIKKVL